MLPRKMEKKTMSSVTPRPFRIRRPRPSSNRFSRIARQGVPGLAASVRLRIQRHQVEVADIVRFREEHAGTAVVRGGDGVHQGVHAPGHQGRDHPGRGHFNKLDGAADRIAESAHQLRFETRLLAVFHYSQAGLAEFDAHPERLPRPAFRLIEGVRGVRSEPVRPHRIQASVFGHIGEELIEQGDHMVVARAERDGGTVADRQHGQLPERGIPRQQVVQARLQADHRIDLPAAQGQAHRRELLIAQELRIREEFRKFRVLRQVRQHPDPGAGQVARRPHLPAGGAGGKGRQGHQQAAQETSHRSKIHIFRGLASRKRKTGDLCRPPVLFPEQ